MWYEAFVILVLREGGRYICLRHPTFEEAEVQYNKIIETMTIDVSVFNFAASESLEITKEGKVKVFYIALGRIEKDRRP